MLILLFVYSLMQGAQSEAGPIPASIERRDVASCDRQNPQRTLANIIWSCLSTIFLCTWVAVHPNIHFRPEKKNKHWTEKWLLCPLYEFVTYKLPLFLWALLIPEYILSWAVRQYLQAGVISKKVPGWTRTHGHFMIMGGFHLFRLPPDVSSVPLHPEYSKTSDYVIPLGRHMRLEDVPICPLEFEDIPVKILEIVAPTEAEIKDKSKSDVLTKLIVLVQTMWFVLQCIARGAQHLPLTELEVVTLAYAMLNLFIYLFWWDKPQNVECPIRLYKTVEASAETASEAAKGWEESWSTRWMEKIIWYAVGAQDNYITLRDQRSIPRFWSGRLGSLLGQAGMGPSILGAAFGAVHCIAWASQFPSGAEFVLWRLSCVSMITFPFIVTVFCTCWIMGWGMKGGSPTSMGIVLAICVVLLILSASLYTISRIATLVISFTTLRSLPPTAFMTVDWTTFIPHI
ncbi:hypothetical protein M408DRAFT_29395 [Serendipita vermifera MAFF 305830]|uniref:Wax synthase domain-containing protein n=1 Tax=Serendipita vermifera MAFF 305830 TaxID=933852 RepID=A0A0C3ANP8_SERVB|nr:hypothetical protein M408DRAFT_29395 [Serendipita vermifera MAFF 305830]